MDLDEHAQDPSRKVAASSLLTNGFTALAAVGGVVLTGSATMLGLGVNATANLATHVGWLTGQRRSGRTGRARRALAHRHPAGHQRERFFGAFALGMLLCCAGSVFLLGEGVRRLHQSPTLEGSSPAVAVAVAVVVVTGGSLVRAAMAVQSDLVVSGLRSTRPASWWRYLVGTRRPVLAAVLVEDSIALGCRLAAAVSVILADQLGEPAVETAGLLVVAGLTGAAAGLHAVLLKQLVVGEGATGTDQQGIAAAIEIEPSVVRLVHMETYRRGPEELLVAAKVDLIDGLDLAEVAEVTRRLDAGIRRAVPAARAVYLEPDVCRTDLDRGEAPDVRLSKPDLFGRILGLTWLRSLRAPTGDDQIDDVDEPDRVGQPPASQ